jgi:hypothetical protein
MRHSFPQSPLSRTGTCAKAPTRAKAPYRRLHGQAARLARVFTFGTLPFPRPTIRGHSRRPAGLPQQSRQPTEGAHNDGHRNGSDTWDAHPRRNPGQHTWRDPDAHARRDPRRTPTARSRPAHARRDPRPPRATRPRCAPSISIPREATDTTSSTHPATTSGYLKENNPQAADIGHKLHNGVHRSGHAAGAERPVRSVLARSGLRGVATPVHLTRLRTRTRARLVDRPTARRTDGRLTAGRQYRVTRGGNRWWGKDVSSAELGTTARTGARR